MTTSQMRQSEMLQRVREFGDTHRELFPASSLGGQAFAAVATAVHQLKEQEVSKRTTAGGKRGKAAARRALIARLKAIRRSARVIARGSPDFDDPFHLEHPCSDQELLTSGLSFIRGAEAVQGRFVAYGMPADFVASLRALVDDFAKAMRSGEAGKDDIASSRVVVEGALAAGFAAVQDLDIIVANRLQDDARTMAVWERNRKVDYATRTRRVASPAVAPADTPPEAGEPAPRGGGDAAAGGVVT